MPVNNKLKNIKATHRATDTSSKPPTNTNEGLWFFRYLNLTKKIFEVLSLIVLIVVSFSFFVCYFSKLFMLLVAIGAFFIKLGIKHFIKVPEKNEIIEKIDLAKRIFKEFIFSFCQIHKICAILCVGVATGGLLAFGFTFIPNIPAKAMVEEFSYAVCDNVEALFGVEQDSKIGTDTNDGDYEDDSDSSDEYLKSLSPKMTFIIDNNDFSMCIDMIQDIAYLEVENIDEYFNKRYNSKIAVGKDNDFIQIQTEEDKFLEKIEKCEEIKSQSGQCMEWYSSLPNEQELTRVIEMQEIAAVGKPCYLILDRISNNYQKLALEYYHQKSNKSTIKFYYLQSIKYDLDAIAYAENPMQFYRSFDRIKTRYKDIIFCCNPSKDEFIYLASLIEAMNKFELK